LVLVDRFDPEKFWSSRASPASSLSLTRSFTLVISLSLVTLFSLSAYYELPRERELSEAFRGRRVSEGVKYGSKVSGVRVEQGDTLFHPWFYVLF
jgi:hypothetical protein